MGGHLAAQTVANVAAAMFFFFALKPSFLSSVPTALRLGAGCGISMLVSVLGMRGVGLLSADSFELGPLTWQSVRRSRVVVQYLILFPCRDGTTTAAVARDLSRLWQLSHLVLSDGYAAPHDSRLYCPCCHVSE